MPFHRKNMIAALLAVSVAGCQNDGGRSQDSGAVPGKAGAASEVANAVFGATQQYRLANFTRIELLGSDDVKVRRGDQFQVRATGSESDLAQLELRLDSGKLLIGRKSGTIVNSSKVQIDIVMPALAGLTLTGSGDMDADQVSGDVVELGITGSGDLTVRNLTAKQANLTITGAGELEVKGGQIETGVYKLTGSGDLDAEKLTARSLTISVSGSGDVEAAASGNAEIQILGSGDVKVRGGAQCVTRKSGSGAAVCS